MKRLFKFQELNPIVSFLFFILIFVITMLSFNPIIIAISLLFSIINNFIYFGKRTFKMILLDVIIISVMGLINPLISHNGKTVLFTLINSYTLESLVFGVVSGAMVCSVINYSKILSFIIDSSKFNYLFGFILPKTSLVLSISYNDIPRLINEHHEIDDRLKALGYYSSSRRKDKIRSKLKSYSMLISWSLENSIETADSMVARGYTNYRRTNYIITKFRFNDYLLLLLVLALGGSCVYLLASTGSFVFYPYLGIEEILSNYKYFIMYGLIIGFNLLIALVEGGNVLRWHYLKSRI